MKRILLASTALIAFAGTALAADLPARSYSKAPVVDPGINWTGFYIGAMGGYGWSDEVRVGGLTASSSDLKGGFAGGTIGYNWQAGSQFVFGIEADAAWSDIKYREPFLFGTTLEDRIRSFGSVTGRLGWAANAALFYVKGGYAWADNRLALQAPGATLFSESKMLSGWTIGGGLEYMFAPNWSGKVEYMFADYGSERYLRAFAPAGIELGATVHTVKGGINYHFNWGGPVVARY
jgi:outer membrane immunogenic protein